MEHAEKAAKGASEAAQALRQADADARAQALASVHDALEAAWPDIEAANHADLAASDGIEPSLRDRLRLDRDKFASALDGLRQIQTMDDPLDRTLRCIDLDDGLRLYQHTTPIGVLCCIFESRPDVAIQIPALSIKTANAVLLKGGSEAKETNNAIVAAVRSGLDAAGSPPDAVRLLRDRSDVADLLALDHLVDLVIPRGSNALVRSIQERTQIPVLGHADGVCHVYIDAEADLELAEKVILDAKLDYPSACNAVETVLVHERLQDWWQDALARLESAGVRPLAGTRAAATGAGGAGRSDAADTDPADPWHQEFGDARLQWKIVGGVDEAIEHINRHGSHHTDAIITKDPKAKSRFVTGVDSAGVYVNASTRFADGYRYGLGAEVGISTGKLHARGPVGLDGLLSTRWVLVGEGHTAGEFKDRPFLHRPASDDYQRLRESWQS